MNKLYKTYSFDKKLEDMGGKLDQPGSGKKLIGSTRKIKDEEKGDKGFVFSLSQFEDKGKSNKALGAKVELSPTNAL